MKHKPASPLASPALAPAMAPLEIRLLGGFELRWCGTPLEGLDSSTVRALIAYLACHSGRHLERETLAGLLWPEVDEAASRHNLRQALYSLRQALAGAGVEETPIEATRHTLGLAPGETVRVDVRAFAEAVARGQRPDGTIDPAQLARAAQLYRGDLLAGFYLRDSSAFEEWLIAEQERLKEVAATALRQLVRHHLEMGSYPLGMQAARQLLRIDPFSEETHRDLIQLYAASGRRSRALAHYRELTRQLRRELGVEPSSETQALARSIESEELRPVETADAEPSRGPVIRFVGRSREMEQLQMAWSTVQRGAARLTLVEGPAGIGKTRLVRTFLHLATSSVAATVLLGSSFEGDPPIPYRPFAEALGNAIATDPDTATQILVASGHRALEILAPVVPELVTLDPRLEEALHRTGPKVPADDLAGALARVLGSLSDRGGLERPARPLILFLDDLHAADTASIGMVEALFRSLSHQPCWFLCAYRPDPLPERHPLRRLAALAGRQGVSRIQLEPLGREPIGQVVEALLGEPDPLFAGRLFEQSGGHPLMTAELVNLLADQEGISRLPSRTWSLTPSSTLGCLERSRVEEVLGERLLGLPTSTRRLLSLAAVLGQTFAPDLLQEAEGEHTQVVDLALELLTDRWFVRPFPRYWADSRIDRFRALAGGGARTASFEFTHPSLRALVYRSLPAERIRYLHGKVAESLENRRFGGVEGPVELLAHHFRIAGNPAKAAEYALAAARRAERLGAEEIALAYRRNADEALSRLGR
ncbi:MAG TPA: AAA family ATPase [Thermoanaerobaculia bacterium]|nr:AAA family ATPase [Thermoanaerobaculia bacterium]